MDLEDATPFSVLAYDVVVPRDARDARHHVIVARGTYELREAAAPGPVTHVAVLSGDQAPLVFSDQYHGEVNRSSVKVESDLAQEKPRCDVIVLGSAVSPTGEPVARVDVGIRIVRPPVPARRPAGTLLDLRLAVHGPRAFEKRDGQWVLGDAEPFVSLPLRYEHAFGGELKVYPRDEIADRVGDANRLPDEARARHPEGEAAPVAHATCLQNPVGVGYLEGWYAEAARVERWPAPRVESPDAPITAGVFERMLRGDARPGEAPALSPRGVGVIAKPWSPRLRLAGTFDDRWRAERWPYMPPDFDMAYWNGAHPDMRCEHLYGSERVELTHLLSGAGAEASFALPGAGVTVRYVRKDGRVALAAVPIDTLVIDLGEMRLSLVWRAVCSVEGGIVRATLRATGHDAVRAA